LPDITLNNKPIHIAIIGGGFCGTMTAINLMHKQGMPLEIHLINNGYPMRKGVAYSPHTSSLLLNVPNGKMSAYSHLPDHFLLWLRKNHLFSYLNKDELAVGFSTREQYGQYLNYLWKEAMDRKAVHVEVKLYEDYAIDIIEDGDHFQVQLQSHSLLTTDYVILATGNAEPAVPSCIPLSFRSSKKYFANPWKKDCIEDLDAVSDILIIGNGLTMSDTVIGLTENGFKGKIHTISPHGYDLKPWKENKLPCTAPEYPVLSDAGTGLHELLKVINQRRKIAGKLHQSLYPTVDRLRPYTQKIWQTLSIKEKRHFVKYLSHHWGSLRHRIPVQMHDFIADIYAQARLITYKGQVTELKENNDQVNITLECSDGQKYLSVQRIINCTGPSTKLSANELLNNLEEKGLICSDQLQMGINADPKDGRVLDLNGRKLNLFVIGGNLKGTLWESTAVPELRVQAEQLADYIAAISLAIKTNTGIIVTETNH